MYSLLNSIYCQHHHSVHCSQSWLFINYTRYRDLCVIASYTLCFPDVFHICFPPLLTCLIMMMIPHMFSLNLIWLLMKIIEFPPFSLSYSSVPEHIFIQGKIQISLGICLCQRSLFCTISMLFVDNLLDPMWRKYLLV